MADIQQGLTLLGLSHLIVYVVWVQTYWWVAFIGIVGVAVMVGLLTRPREVRQNQSSGYGTAHMATPRELRTHHLHRTEGIFVGRAYGNDLRVPRSHLMIIGPSECGKTKSIGLGTEIEWPGSVLALDIKGEHIRLGASLREQRGNLVSIFEPRLPASGHINLLDLVPFGEEEEVAAIQRVSDHMTDPGEVKLSEGALFYRNSDRSILEAAFLYQGNYGDQPASFARTRVAMGSMNAMLDAMAQADHPIISSVVQHLKGLRMEPRATLWNSARNRLWVFDDPILARNTNDTTIHLETLQHGEQPQTVYIRVTPDDARGSLRLFIRLLLDQHLATAGQRRVVTDFRHHELINLDDQFEIGYLAAADHTGAFYREHGLWLMSTFQSFEQLGAYGKHASLLDNSKTWVIFRPNHTESAKTISQKLGKTTVQDRHVARHTSGRSTTTILHERDLMTPFEVEHIPDFTAFVFVSGVCPILAQQVSYTERDLR